MLTQRSLETQSQTSYTLGNSERYNRRRRRIQRQRQRTLH